MLLSGGDVGTYKITLIFGDRKCRIEQSAILDIISETLYLLQQLPEFRISKPNRPARGRRRDTSTTASKTWITHKLAA
jgi:hypothetical protein